MATPKKTEEKNQSIEPVKNEALDVDLVTIPVTLRNGAKLDIKMYRDPMDASDEVLEHAETGNIMAYVRGLITPASKFELKRLGNTGHDLVETIFPAYQEATGQGED